MNAPNKNIRVTLVKVLLLTLVVFVASLAALSFYLLFGVKSAYFEEQSLQKVKAYRITSSTTLESVILQRLLYHGDPAIPRWICADYGNHVIVRACVGNMSAECCAVFWSTVDGKRVVPVNNLAIRLVPELKRDTSVVPIGVDDPHAECFCGNISAGPYRVAIRN